MSDENKLPTIFNDDEEEYGDRLLQGGRAKWVDKVWTLDGIPSREEDRWLVKDTGFVLQRWVEGLPEIIWKEPGKSLPDPEHLNSEIPRAEWPLNKFTGEREGPWKIVAFAHLLRERDAARYTHVNSTWGTRICVPSIRERIRDMSTIRRVAVDPIVRLTSAPMPSKKFPGRFRPELEVLGWRPRGGDQPAQIEPPKSGSGTTAKQIGKIEPPTIQEELNDSINF
jgi:hypothetical protein